MCAFLPYRAPSGNVSKGSIPAVRRPIQPGIKCQILSTSFRTAIHHYWVHTSVA